MEEFDYIMGFIQIYFKLSKTLKVNIIKGTIISKGNKIPVCMAWCLTHMIPTQKYMNTLKFPKINYVFGPFFILKSFFTLKFFLHTKDSELKANMCSFCINKGEEQNISWRGIYCTTFIIMMMKMKEKSKLRLKYVLPPT